MKNIFKKAARFILFYFFQGVLFVVPAAATLYVIFNLFVFLDELLPVDYPGLGLITLMASLTVLGIFANTIIAKPLKIWGQGILKRAPFIKTIYSAFADLMTAFVGKKKSFNKPVLVKMSANFDVEKPGFITANDLEKIGIDGEKVAVYLPHSYAFSGNLFIVPAKNVTPLQVSSADLMKFIVSGGVAKIELKPKK